MQRNNVTMIDDLPDLDTVDDYGGGYGNEGYNGGNQGRSGGPPMRMEMRGPMPSTEKYIRPTHKMNINSGMAGYAEGYVAGNNGGYATTGYTEERYNPPMNDSPPGPPPYQPPPFNCLDVNNHILDCPICSRFYKNDKTVYIVSIIVLSIICLLLLKRILNV